MYFTNGPGPNGDPAMTMHFYRYMTGFWKDSSSLLYGGNGMPSSGATEPCKYVFPGDSDPLITGTNGLELSGWTEEAAGNTAGDRRGLAASGPFTLNPQDVHYLDVAFVFARQSEGEGTLTETLDDRLKETKLYFNQNLVDCHTPAMSIISVAETKAPSGFEIFPNPSSEAVSVRWTHRADLLTLTDASGREVLRQIASGKSQTSLDVNNLPRGIYLLRLSGQSDSRVMKLVVEK